VNATGRGRQLETANTCKPRSEASGYTAYAKKSKGEIRRPCTWKKRNCALQLRALKNENEMSTVSETETKRNLHSVNRPEYVPNRISDPNYVRIFDTTLRDGEQSPGATLTIEEKVKIAKQLSKLGVDIIEAGFPIASPDDFKAVQMIAQTVGQHAQPDGHIPVICGLSRTKVDDLNAAWNAVKDAKLPRVHTFIATSEIHMKYKLKMTPDEVVTNAVNAVKHLKSMGCDDIEFSPEDAGRSDLSFLYRILAEVIQAGATTLNIPDTTGWNMPLEFGSLIHELKQNVPGIDDVVISTHCQNDLGLSTANSLAGALNGARQIECTINGIGERAGNASLEEVAMAIMLRGKEQMGGLHTGIVPEHIYIASKMVSEYSGMVIQPHKAIVGVNAFAHESGIHQDGMLKSRETYEIMSPETIGLNRQVEAGIVLGKHSGRHAVSTRLSEMGYDVNAQELDEIFRRFKDIADKKKGLTDEDLEALVSELLYQTQEGMWEVKEAQIVCGTMGMPTASVKMKGPEGVEKVVSAVGTGPVDACYKAVDQLVQVPTVLADYSVNAVTEGIDAIAVTRVVVKPADEVSIMYQSASGAQRSRVFTGQGSHTDIVVASTRAYVSALNKMLVILNSDKTKPKSA